VVSPNPLVEEDAADVIARAVDAPIEPGFLLLEEILSAPAVGVRHITPYPREFRPDSQAWGWDRADNLLDTYELLYDVEPGRIVGTVLAFRTLPGLRAATAIASFAAGNEDHEAQRVAYSLAATYAGTGARLSRLLNPRRFLHRALRAQVATWVSWLRPHSLIRVDEMTAFWHPPLNDPRERENRPDTQAVPF
jgi:hypothetical protein